MWLANDNPGDQKELEKMGLIEYYFRLDKKAKNVKKQYEKHGLVGKKRFGDG